MSQLSATVLLRIANSNVGESATTVGVVGHRRQRQAPRHLHADLAAPTQIAATKKLDPHTHSLLPRVATPNQQRANILLDRSRHLSHVDTCMLPVAINVAPASVLSVRPATSTGSVFL